MKKLFIILLLQLYSMASYAGLQLEATRVIYHAGNSSGTLALKNNTDKNYMLQVWLETADKNKNGNIPFQVVPPIMKIKAGDEATIRIIYAGQGLPADKESLFWINTQEIPPAADHKNVLQIAVHSRLKLFYRPGGLKTSLDDEVKKLSWSREGNTIAVTNNGPMYISLNKLHSSDGRKNADADIDMVAPHATRRFTVPATVKINHTVSFSYVNDYGGISEVTDIPLK